MSGILPGKVAMVTGSGRGIGKAVAQRFGAEGCKVVVTDLTEEAAQATAESIKSNQGSALAISCDIRDATQVHAVVRAAVEQWGSLDILVNNAAIFPERVPFPEVKFEKWREVLEVNLFGTFHCTQVVVREMIRSKTRGRIINISSECAFRYRRGTIGQTPYNISKAALDNMTKGLAIELAPYGIVVNGIAPGFVETSMAATDPLDEPDFRKEYLDSGRIPLGRYGSPDDCANLAVFLASDLCTNITGETIIQDGGLHITF